jgi:hypothetical protein
VRAAHRQAAHVTPLITGIDAPLPEKPKGMWVRTYARLLEKTLQAEMLADDARTNLIQRLVAQTENHRK